MKLFLAKAVMSFARFVRDIIGIDSDTQIKVIPVNPGMLVMVGDNHALTFTHSSHSNTIKFLTSDTFQKDAEFILQNAKEAFGDISINSVGHACLIMQKHLSIEYMERKIVLIHTGTILLTVLKRDYENQTAIEEQSTRILSIYP
jgi:hypothetical protein